MRFKKWYECTKLFIGYNKAEIPKKLSQRGGTAIIVKNKLVSRIRLSNDSGSDPWGRWTWTTLYGKDCIKVKILTGYGPHAQGGPASYVAQLRTQMLKKEDLRHPRIAFWEDLKTLLLQWKEEGNQIIAAGDWNKCSKTDNLREFFDLVNMVESYRILHGTPPDTVLNKSSRTIDTFWTSRLLQIQQSGYLDYGDGVCKLHRIQWIDVTFISAFGQTIPNVISPTFNCRFTSQPTHFLWKKILFFWILA